MSKMEIYSEQVVSSPIQTTYGEETVKLVTLSNGYSCFLLEINGRIRIRSDDFMGIYRQLDQLGIPYR